MSTPPIIIISEPDPMISSVLRVEFSRWDFAVLLAVGSEEAEAYASQAVACLIVLDAKKALGAYEACARIRRRDGYATRPIVITASEISPRTLAAAELAGATALLPKPYSMMDLFRAVAPHLTPDDPFLRASPAQAGVAEPASQEWKPASALQWRSGHESALSRNRLLLPIVRGAGRRIPLIRET
jgi:DNA-binding response OmpR family regulator